MRPVWATWASVLAGVIVGTTSGAVAVGRVSSRPGWLLAGGGAVALWHVAVKAIDGLGLDDADGTWSLVRGCVDLAVAWGALGYTLVCLPAVSWFAFALGVLLVAGAGGAAATARNATRRRRF